MGFTTDEVQQVVQQLVSTTIRQPYGALGTRQLDVPFADYQNAAAAVFLLSPRAPFYVLSLATKRLMDAVTSEANIVQQLLEAVQALSNKTFPITDLTGLANAGAALTNLNNASSARTSSFGDLSKVPAYQQFINSTNAFLQSAGSNVKLNGQLVQTPQQARAAIPGLVSQLKAAHTALDQEVRQLAQGMDNYNGVNLPSLVATSVISNAQGLLANQLAALSALTPDARLEMIRQVVIEICASQAAVKTFSSFSGPTPYLTVDGTGSLFADATHPAVPAVAVCDGLSPFASYSGHSLVDVWVDVAYPLLPKFQGTASQILPIAGGAYLFGTNIGAGVIPTDVVYVDTGTHNVGTRWVVVQVINPGQLSISGPVAAVSETNIDVSIYKAPTQSFNLPNSVIPNLLGGIDETYVIVAAQNQVLILETIDTVTNQNTVTFPPGTFNADDIANLINLSLVGFGMNLAAAAYFGTKKFGDYVNISVLGPNSARFTFLMGTPSQFNLKVGDMVAWPTTPGAQTFSRWTITALGVTWVDTTSSTFILAPSNNVYVEMGSNRRVRIFTPNAALALSLRTKVVIKDDPTAAGAIQTLGFFPGAYMQATPTTAATIAGVINGQTSAFVAGTQNNVVLATTARTEPLSVYKIVFSKWQGLGSVTNVTGTGPYVVTIVAVDPANDVSIGDIIVLRSGSTANLFFTITAVDFTTGTITATGSSSPGLDSNINVEVGPTVTAHYGMMISVPGGANSGNYYVDVQQPIPIEVNVQTNLPIPVSNGQPVSLGIVTLGNEEVTMTSLTKTMASYIFVREPVAVLTANKLVQGFVQTPYFQLPELPQALEAGDMVEIYLTGYATPDATFNIDEIDSTLLVLTVDPDMTPQPPYFTSYTFSETTAVPFARLRAGKVVNWQAFENQLNTWLGVFPVSPYFTALNALINPLLVNRTPTAVQINDARNKLLGLAGLLTIAGAQAAHSDPEFALETILDSYSVDPVASVDTLFNAFAERGLDRSLDLLLVAQFQEFFSLTTDTGSYTGNLLAAAAAVAQNDIPVNPNNNPQQLNSRLTQVAQSPDYEYDTSDGNTGPNNTPPLTDA